jgi:hypothetical protein
LRVNGVPFDRGDHRAINMDTVPRKGRSMSWILIEDRAGVSCGGRLIVRLRSKPQL